MAAWCDAMLRSKKRYEGGPRRKRCSLRLIVIYKVTTDIYCRSSAQCVECYSSTEFKKLFYTYKEYCSDLFLIRCVWVTRVDIEKRKEKREKMGKVILKLRVYVGGC